MKIDLGAENARPPNIADERLELFELLVSSRFA